MARTEGANRRHRYNEIGRILISNGFDWLMTEYGFDALLGRARKWRGRSKALTYTQPERLRRALGELGPTFIKLGQLLSARPDLLPPEYIVELSKLQDQAPLVDYSEIAAVIERELGAPPEEVFQTFSVEPRAAASIGQVHDATLHDGSRVVVKIQRPGIELIIEEDLAILKSLARAFSQNSPIGKQYDFENLADEFAFALRNELDYRREGRNADRIRENFVNDPSLRVPAIHWDLTTKRALTMEEIAGIKISDLAALDAAGIDRHELAVRCASIAVAQTLDHGFFHADPHPGNFFVLPDGVIGLIDFGMVGYLEDRLSQALARLAYAVTRRDTDQFIDELLTLGAAPGPIDRQTLRRDLNRLLQRYAGVSIGEISATQIFNDATDLSRRHRLQLPSDLTLLAKVIVMDEGLGALLDPGFNLIEFAIPHLKRFWIRSHSLSVVTRRAREGAIDMAEIGLDLPQRFRHLLALLDRGDLTVTSRLELPEEIANRFQQAANRVAVSVIVAGSAIGLSVLESSPRSVGSVGLIGVALRLILALGIACGVWLMVAFWRSRR